MALMVVVPRTASQLLRSEDDILFDAEAWRDTVIASHARALTNLFAPEIAVSGPISVGSLFGEFPVGLLLSPEMSDTMVSGNAAAHTRT